MANAVVTVVFSTDKLKPEALAFLDDVGCISALNDTQRTQLAELIVTVEDIELVVFRPGYKKG